MNVPIPSIDSPPHPFPLFDAASAANMRHLPMQSYRLRSLDRRAK
jgi:hypothetical protein